jgi:hypothetical protein
VYILKIKILLLLFVLVFTLTGCVITSEKPTAQPTTEKPQETSQEETTGPGEDETVEPVDGNDDDIVTIMPVDNYHTAKGIYTGRADTSAIEIKTIDGYMTLTLYRDDEERMLGEILSESAVFVEYETNNIGQNVVVNIELAPEPSTLEILGNETSGVFMAHRDEDKCHIRVDEQTRLFWIASELRTQGFDELSKENLIEFNYYTDEYGRDVIIGFEIV